MNRLKRAFELFVALGQNQKLLRSTIANDTVKRVAAGDPSLPICNCADRNLTDTITVDGRTIDLADYESYLVCGRSMHPEGINDGDTLLARQLRYDEYKRGDFLIIAVDYEYYKKYNPKTVIYSYKLRRAMLRVPVGVTDDELIAKMKECDYSAYLEEMQRYAIRKYMLAREAYPDKELMLSTTYHDGEQKYSFHPVEQILGRAEIQITHNRNIILSK